MIERGDTLATMAYKKIESMILAGTLRPGERLNEHQFSVEFGLSRGPIREACRALERDGLVHAVKAKGVFVRQLSLRELDEIYDLRALLTGFMCQLAAEKSDGAGVARLVALNDEMKADIAKSDRDAYYSANLAFHTAIAEMADSSTAKRTYDGLVKETHAYRVSVLKPEASVVEHDAIIEAIRRNDAAAARRLGEEHVIAGKQRWHADRSDRNTEEQK